MAGDDLAPSLHRQIGAALLHLVFPSPCHTCGLPLDSGRRGPLCRRCWQSLERRAGEGCSRCGQPLQAAGAACPLCSRCRTRQDAFEIARAPFVYRETGTVRAAILLAKHAGQRGLLAALADALAREAPACLTLTDWDAVVPVPLHWQRRWRRGLNQADVLARAVGRRHGLPCGVGRWSGREPPRPSRAALTIAAATCGAPFVFPDRGRSSAAASCWSTTCLRRARRRMPVRRRCGLPGPAPSGCSRWHASPNRSQGRYLLTFSVPSTTISSSK